MGFTKLDELLLRSSILMENSDIFKIWILLLAACGKDGIAKVSPIYLSSVGRLDIEIVEQALKVLESPDKYSRSTNDEGRRIERVDGGFRIINYHKYRERHRSDTSAAERQRRYRERKNKELQRKKRNVTSRNDNVTSHSASASASTSASKEGECEGETKRKRPGIMHKWGEHQNVKITDIEQERLVAEHGAKITEAAIKEVDEYLETTGKRYKNHNLVLQKWGIRAGKEQCGQPEPREGFLNSAAHHKITDEEIFGYAR